MTRTRAKVCPGLPWVVAALALAGLSLGCDAEDPSDPDASVDGGRSPVQGDAAMGNDARMPEDSGPSSDASMPADSGPSIDAAYSCEPLSDEGGSPEAAPVQVALIRVTASTNAEEILVAIYDDGSAERTLGAVKWGVGTSPPPRSYPAGSAEVEKFLCDLSAIPDLSAVGDHIERYDQTACAKSASFGTMTMVTADGMTSGDVQCLVHPTPATSALAEDCDILTERNYTGASACPRELGFFGAVTRVPLAAVCSAIQCPATFSEAIDAVRDDPMSAEVTCGYRYKGGCGVDSVALFLGTHHTVFHYSSATGALLGAEFDDDVKQELAGCGDWTFIGGEGRPSCSITQLQDLCGLQDDGGI